jgi:hypothetical protein
MAAPHYPSGTPGQSWTFNDLANWIDSKYPGGGQQFIDWIRNNNTVPPPYKLNLNSRTFGPGGFGSNNTAYAWFTTWFAQEVVGKGIATNLGKGIQGGAQLIPKALKGAAKGIGDIPGRNILTNPLEALGSFLTQRSLWIRVAEGILGGALVIVAVSKLGGESKIGRAATKAGKAAFLL